MEVLVNVATLQLFPKVGASTGRTRQHATAPPIIQYACVVRLIAGQMMGHRHTSNAKRKQTATVKQHHQYVQIAIVHVTTWMERR